MYRSSCNSLFFSLILSSFLFLSASWLTVYPALEMPINRKRKQRRENAAKKERMGCPTLIPLLIPLGLLRSLFNLFLIPIVLVRYLFNLVLIPLVLLCSLFNLVLIPLVLLRSLFNLFLISLVLLRSLFNLVLIPLVLLHSLHMYLILF